MHEYATVSSSSYDPASLAAKLTEKSAEGWHVVAIVPTGGDVTAFLSRKAADADQATQSEPTQAMPVASAPEATMMTMIGAEAEPAPEPTAEPVSEPAGWAVAPAAEPVMPVAAAPQPVVEVVSAE